MTSSIDRFYNVARNSALSIKAKGIYLCIDSGLRTIEAIMSHSNSGRETTRSALNELTKHGFVELVINRSEDGSFDGSEYRLVSSNG